MDDLLIDETGELLLASGDFKQGDALLQNQRLILLSNPGEWKQSPTTGVGLELYLEDDTTDDLMTNIREQLAADGQTIETLKVLENGNIAIKSNY